MMETEVIFETLDGVAGGVPGHDAGANARGKKNVAPKYKFKMILTFAGTRASPYFGTDGQIIEKAFDESTKHKSAYPAWTLT